MRAPAPGGRPGWPCAPHAAGPRLPPAGGLVCLGCAGVDRAPAHGPGGNAHITASRAQGTPLPLGPVAGGAPAGLGNGVDGAACALWVVSNETPPVCLAEGCKWPPRALSAAPPVRTKRTCYGTARGPVAIGHGSGPAPLWPTRALVGVSPTGGALAVSPLVGP